MDHLTNARLRDEVERARSWLLELRAELGRRQEACGARPEGHAWGVSTYLALQPQPFDVCRDGYPGTVTSRNTWERECGDCGLRQRTTESTQKTEVEGGRVLTVHSPKFGDNPKPLASLQDLFGGTGPWRG